MDTDEDSGEPTPPEQLPAYLTDAISRQSAERLRIGREWIDELIDYRNRQRQQDVRQEELTNSSEELVDVESTDQGTRVVKKIPCGKDSCTTCPHGPYLYIVNRSGDGLDWQYKGPVKDEGD